MTVGGGQTLEDDDRIAEFYRRKLLCRTIAGNRCDFITITEPSNDIEEMRAKRGVVITARVHPGETNASWMMEVRVRGTLELVAGTCSRSGHVVVSC